MSLSPLFLILAVPLATLAVAIWAERVFGVWDDIRPLDRRTDGHLFNDRVREAATLLAIVPLGVAVILLYGGEFGPDTDPNAALAGLVILMPALAFGYFCWVVPYVLYLSIDDQAFDADAIRLARDALMSITVNIVAAALVYRWFGLNAPDWNPRTLPGDYLYFSAVTFSTLGYGDFAPSADARPFAALYAILGNLHLGIVVGAVLVALKGRDGPRDGPIP